jgi:hypothetical protein
VRKLPEVLRFIWYFDKANNPRIEALREQYRSRVPVERVS